MTYTYNRKGSLIFMRQLRDAPNSKDISSLENIVNCRKKILTNKCLELIKILRSFAYLVRYALRARRATKALRCFIILTLTLFLRCIFQIPPLRPKDSGNAKMLVACLRVVLSQARLCAETFTATTPPARVNLWVGGRLPARVGLGLKTAVKRDAVLCGATCRKIFVFPLTSRLRVVLPRNF